MLSGFGRGEGLESWLGSLQVFLKGSLRFAILTKQSLKLKNVEHKSQDSQSFTVIIVVLIVVLSVGYISFRLRVKVQLPVVKCKFARD